MSHKGIRPSPRLSLAASLCGQHPTPNVLLVSRPVRRRVSRRSLLLIFEESRFEPILKIGGATDRLTLGIGLRGPRRDVNDPQIKRSRLRAYRLIRDDFIPAVTDLEGDLVTR